MRYFLTHLPLALGLLVPMAITHERFLGIGGHSVITGFHSQPIMMNMKDAHTKYYKAAGKMVEEGLGNQNY